MCAKTSEHPEQVGISTASALLLSAVPCEWLATTPPTQTAKGSSSSQASKSLPLRWTHLCDQHILVRLGQAEAILQQPLEEYHTEIVPRRHHMAVD